MAAPNGTRLSDFGSDCTRFVGTVTPNARGAMAKSDSPETAGTVTFGLNRVPLRTILVSNKSLNDNQYCTATHKF